MKLKFLKNKIVILAFLLLSLFIILPFLNLNLNLNIDTYNIKENSNLKISATNEIIEDWNRTTDGSNENSVGGTAYDNLGNVYIVGGNGSSGTDLTVQKYDPDGNLLWSRKRSGNKSITSFDSASDVAIDSQNNVYITGEININVGEYNMILIKYNSSGAYQWNKTWIDNSAVSSFGKALVIDKLDNIYVAGNFRPSPPDWSKAILLKYNSSGKLLWEKTHQSSKYTYSNDLELDSKGFIYLAGDNHSGSYNSDIWVSKFTNSSSQSNALKNITYQTINEIEKPSIDLDSADKIYISSTNYTSSSNHILLLIYNEEGTLIHEKPYHLKETKSGGIKVEKNMGYIYIIGTNKSSDFFNKSALIIKYNSSYNFQWNKTWNPNDNGISGKAISLNSKGYLYAGILGNNKYYLTKFDFTTKPSTFNLWDNASNPEQDGNFTLKWDTSFNARNYSIYKYNKPITSINESLTIIAEGLKTNHYQITNHIDGVYYYAVAANNKYGSTLSNNISVYIQLIPQNFTLSTNASSPDTDGIFLLEWTPSQFANNYSIYNDTAPIDSIHSGLGLVADHINELNYTISTTKDQSIYYAVVAFNDNGDKMSNNVFVTAEIHPKSFTLTSNETQDNDGFYTLNWTDSIRANNYTVYSYDKYITEINNSLTVQASEITDLFLDISLNQDGIYYYIIQAQNNNGNTTSNCISVEVTIIPREFTLTANETHDYDGFYSLNWTISDKANNYTIYSYDKYITEINNSLTVEASEITDLILDISLNQDGIYYYIIQARNTYGNTTSNCVSVEVTIIPRNFTLSSDAQSPDIDGIFQLSWTASDKAINYTVYQNSKYITEINSSLTKIAEFITIRNWNLSINEDGDYYYIVVAFNEYGNSSSNVIFVDIKLPPAAFNLTSNATYPDIDGNFILTWDDSNRANNYTIYNSSNFIDKINGTLSITALEIDRLNFTFSNLSEGIYYFIVEAHNHYGNTSSQCIKIWVRYPPSSFSLTHDAEDPEKDGKFNLNWTAADRAVNYSIYYSSNYITKINDTVKLIELGLTQNTYHIFNTSGNYYFQIIAFNEAGNSTSNNVFISIKIPPGNFTVFSNDAGDPDQDGEFRIEWTASTYASHYLLYYSLEPIENINENNLIQLYNGTNLFFDIEESHDLDDSHYYFVVISKNNYGNNTSNELKITVGNPDALGDTGLPWWLQAIFTGIISASAGLVIKLSYSRYKKRKEFYDKMTEKFERIDNIESFLEENLGYDEWQRLKEPLDLYKKNQITEKDLIKKGKKELGDRFTELLKK